jgi:hypothetical protein
MSTRTFTTLLGAVFLGIGILGFVPGAHMHVPPDAPPLRVDGFYGYLLGLFPVNVLHNLVHVAFGIWGLAAARSLASAITYNRVVAASYAVLAVMGLIPGLNVLFGLLPIYGHDVWLHAVIAAGAAYYGFVAHETRQTILTQRHAT